MNSKEKGNKVSIAVDTDNENKDPIALNKVGNKYFGQGKYAEAIEYYQKASDLVPQEWIYHNNLGDAYRYLKNWSEAQKAYNKVLEINPRDDFAWNSLGLTFALSGDYKQAIPYFIKAILLRPKATYYLNVGDAYKKVKNWPEAQDYYEGALAVDPESTEALNTIAMFYFSRKDYQNAIKHFKLSQSLMPDEFTYFNYLGDAYKLLGEYDLAVENYTRAISLDKYDFLSRTSLGDAYISLRQWDQAIACFEEGLEFIQKTDQRRYEILLIRLGRTHSQKKDFPKTLHYFQEATKVNPENLTSLSYLGDTYGQMKDWDQSIHFFEKALKIDGEDAFSLNGIGIAFYSKRKYDKAIQYYEKAVSLAPDSSIYTLNLADAYRAIEEFEKATESYLKAKEINPDDSTIYSGLAATLSGVGKYHLALKQYQQAIGLDPKPKYYISLAKIYSRLQQFGNSLGSCQKADKIAKEINPNDHSYERYVGLTYNDWGVSFDSKHKYKEAAEKYRLAIQYNSGDPVQHHNLYLALRSLWMEKETPDLLKEAQESLLIALELDPGNAKYKQELEKINSDLKKGID